MDKMEKLGIKPNVITWNSLISGFAQKGDDAMVSKMFELMISKGVEPDVISWTSVISGLVQNFPRHLAELEPENAGNNMLMSNLYADAGSWENVSRSKKMMKRKRLKNFPGCSWIEEAT
ncbi:hypothetical protein D5086_002199 [Populus alba]|uniref:Uncharacterized protein n=1 Tax=Populus alba TaxID=43335 RepID=A0ACC4D1Q3_POPAL